MNRFRGGKEMPVVSVINYKGGVGKTTLTANVAAELANNGKRVLAIDLDPQTNLTFSFVGVEEWRARYKDERTIKYWFDQILDQDQVTNLSKLIIRPEKINDLVSGSVDLISSHLGLINVDLELATRLGGASPRQNQKNYLKVYSLLRNGLESLVHQAKEKYDVILIDCPPNFNIVTKNALAASDYYLVPARADYLSTLGLLQLKKNVNELIKDYNGYADEEAKEMNIPESIRGISPKLLGVVFTMVSYSKQQPISMIRQYIDEVGRDTPIFEHRIRENKTIFAESGKYGIPVVMQKLSGETYTLIQEEIRELVDEFSRKAGI